MTKTLPFPFVAFLHLCARPPQIKQPDCVKFFLKTKAHTIGTGAFKPTGVGDKSYHPLIANTVAGPADGTDIRIIKSVAQLRFGTSSITALDALIEIFIFPISIVVVFRLLPPRPRGLPTTTRMGATRWADTRLLLSASISGKVFSSRSNSSKVSVRLMPGMADTGSLRADDVPSRYSLKRCNKLIAESHSPKAQR